MLKWTSCLTGSYILNQRVVPDWWHPYMREDAHVHAKMVLAAAVRRDEEAAAMTMGEKKGSSSSSSSGGHHTLSLYEVNALVATFTSNHDVDELSAALQYLREHMQRGLAPCHYHALFRVFNNGGDRDNVAQLLEVMAQRGETTLETYARAVDCVHCLAPADALARILAIVQTAQEAFGSLVFHVVQGSEAATVAAYGAGPERAAALEDPDTLPGPSPPEPDTECAEEDGAAEEEEEDEGDVDEDGSSSPRTSCPTLTALLHHLAMSGSGGGDPATTMVVALWIQALGPRLADWDCVHVVSALLTRVEAFPRVRSLLGAFPGIPAGSVSPNAVLQRLEERGELVATASPLAQVARAMQTSLTAAGVDMDVAVEVGFLNSHATSLHTMLQHALRHLDGPGAAAGLGGHQLNSALLYHTVSIMHSSLRDDAEAVRVLVRAAETQAALQQRSRSRENSLGGGGGGEPFVVGHQHVMDVGSLLPRVSQRTREGVRDVFIRLARDMGQQERESQLQATLLGDAGDFASAATLSTSSAALALATSSAVRRTAAAPPVRPTASDLVGVEAYTLAFLRTGEEALAALHAAVTRVDRSRLRLPRETRLAFKQLAQYCCDHPLPNPKLTVTGLAERHKWGAYLDARDTALSLFGSGKHARDAMKHLYYHGSQLPELRSQAVIEQDCVDTCRFFGLDPSTSGPALLLSQQRTTQPHTRCSPHVVPPHLYDPKVYNPYPHVALRRAPASAEACVADAATTASLPERGSDVFAELWRTLMNPAVMGSDTWYLQNSDMYLLLMRCLLHRLDWEAATHLTAKMLEHSAYTYLMDHELTTIFRETGDPAGCLAFKVATKLFDGRITRDGQTKRERFHQEQFQ